MPGMGLMGPGISRYGNKLPMGIGGIFAP
jgi:hypothetical protein